MKLIQELVKEGLKVKRLRDSNLIELQAFIDLFEDFFVLCEGEKGLAKEILNACPPSKDFIQDKFLLGIYENEQLIGLIDLIQDYPDKKTWTIGYLLIHPNYRSQRRGSSIVRGLAAALSKLQGAKMRCGVQKQNPRALNFWTKCGFKTVKTIQETLGALKNITSVLERLI